MDAVSFREYCLKKKGVSEGFPFGEETLVFKVMGKMFALCQLEKIPFLANLKCDPEKALDLRDQFPDHIYGAYHMNKEHWNSIHPEALPPKLVLELIDHSYDLVVNGLTKKLKSELNNL
jgi:predicted DNA-binding protein (MmcQ/YjbR family)